LASEILYGQSELGIVLALALLLAVAAEAGRRLGQSQRHPSAAREEAQFTSIEGALLALLSLLLGFTFAMALSRFEYRKELVVQESNAIGTAALRARLLPRAERDAALGLLGRYVEVRLQTVLQTAQSSPERQRGDAEAAQLHARLWAVAAAVAAMDPRSVTYGMFAQSVNQLIDVKSQRDVAVANHVPESVLLLLCGIAALSAGILGYGNGLVGIRNRIPAAVYAVVIVLVVLLIVDLDRPQQGLARVSQESMLRVQALLNAASR
jgi:hypothetical protein